MGLTNNGPEGDLGRAKEWGEQKARRASVLCRVRIRSVSNTWQTDCIEEQCFGGDDKVTVWGSVGLGVGNFISCKYGCGQQAGAFDGRALLSAQGSRV